MKCNWKACPYPTGGERECRYHAVFFNYPFSLTGRHISATDIYDSEDGERGRALLSILRPGELKSSHRNVYTVATGKFIRESDPYTDAGWGLRIARVNAELRMEELKRQRRSRALSFPRPKSIGQANGLTVATVVMPDGCLVRTIARPRTGESMAAITGALSPGTPIANHNEKGGFVLWKGFGKKKVRKSQRNRPAGWHGNHPAQKPIKVSRETLDDVPIWTPEAKLKLRAASMYDEPSAHEDEERDQIIATLTQEPFYFEESTV